MSKKEIDPKRVTASGNGVDQGITGQMCMFQVINMANEVDNISTSINGPSQPTMMKGIDENGNAIVKYTPNLPGEYTVTVQYKGKHIKGSPFKVQILGESDPKLEMIKKIEVTGRGILIGKSYMQNDFWIDGRAANLAGAGLSVNIKNPERASSQLKINDMGDGTFKCVYKPTAAGQYIINVKVEGIHVPGSPFYVRIT